MPTSPLRNELLVHSGCTGETERLVLQLIPTPLDSPTNWFPPESPSLPGPTTTPQVFKKPAPEARASNSNCTVSSVNSDVSPASSPRGQSFSSEHSDTPSMVEDCGSDRSEIDRDEDHYHEKVARELDAWHSEEQFHAITMYFSNPAPTPFPSPRIPPSQSDELFIARMEESPMASSGSRSSSRLQHKRHSPNKSSSTLTMRTLQTTARTRSSTIGSQPMIQRAGSASKSTSYSPPPPLPSRPAPMPGRTPTFQPSPPSQNPSAPPVPPKTSSNHSPRSPRRGKNHHAIPGRSKPVPLSLYPSPTTNPPMIPLPSLPRHRSQSQVLRSQALQSQQLQSPPKSQRPREAPPRPRHAKSTPHLRPERCPSPFPLLHNAKFFAHPCVSNVSASANSAVAGPPSSAPVPATVPMFRPGAQPHARGVEAPPSSTSKFQFAPPSPPSPPTYSISFNTSTPLNLPRNWPLNASNRFLQEKSVWEEDEDDEGGRGGVGDEGLLEGVRRKVRRHGGGTVGWGGIGHVRNVSGGGSGSEKENEREREREREKERERYRQGLGKRGGRKLRKSAGDIVKGLFRKGSF